MEEGRGKKEAATGRAHSPGTPSRGETPNADRRSPNDENSNAPLAERMRPRTVEEFVGQPHLLGPGKLIRRLLEAGRVISMILWGPPGSGKTTLARLVARNTGARFVQFSAVLSGVKELREVVREAEAGLQAEGRQTVLFVDEIHRFNKAQQDAFLPHVERGLITLIGATTENPSFEVIAPLLSRSRVLVLERLTHEALEAIVRRALGDPERGLGRDRVKLDPETLSLLTQQADGDARIALNTLEQAAALAPPEPGSGIRRITLHVLQEAIQKKGLLYDKDGEEHYNLISALHKSLRGSDPDAALYWLARMLDAGEDPLYIARRLVRFASEDVGLADPRALDQALAAKESYHFLGSPEGELALVQATVYLATAPKSNALYRAWETVRGDVARHRSLPVPLHLRNAPTALMKGLGYGRGYRYSHDFPEALVAQEYLPEPLQGRTYYRPVDRGYEKTVGERLAYWRKRLNPAKG